jgi:hypothetical protein
MTRLRPRSAGLVGAAVLLLMAGAASAQTTLVPEMPMDRAVNLGGVEAACTGIGLDARDDPQWLAYPVRVEVSNALNEYLTGAIISVADEAGRPVLEANCGGPWLLLKLPAGRYRVIARLPGTDAKPRSATIDTPKTGQMRVVLQFLDQ